MRIALICLLITNVTCAADPNERLILRELELPQFYNGFEFQYDEGLNITFRIETPLTRRAVAVARQAYEAEPNIPFAFATYHEAVIDSADTRTAKRLHERHLAACEWNVLCHPYQSDAWLLLSAVNFRHGRKASSDQASRIAVALQPTHPIAIAARYHYAFDEGRSTEVAEWLRLLHVHARPNDRAAVYHVLLAEWAEFCQENTFGPLHAACVPPEVRAAYADRIATVLRECEDRMADFQKRVAVAPPEPHPIERRYRNANFARLFHRIAAFRSRLLSLQAGIDFDRSPVPEEMLRRTESELSADDPSGPFGLLLFQNFFRIKTDATGHRLALRDDLPPERAARQTRLVQRIHALTDHPDSAIAATAWYYEGQLHDPRSRKAAVCYRNAVERDPTFDIAWAAWLHYYTDADRDHQFTILAAWSAAHPSVRMFGMRATLLGKANRWDEVEATYREALGRYPDDERLQMGLLICRARHAKPDDLAALDADTAQFIAAHPPCELPSEELPCLMGYLRFLQYRLAGRHRATLDALSRTPPTDEIRAFLQVAERETTEVPKCKSNPKQ